jgi:hypothetical protein
MTIFFHPPEFFPPMDFFFGLLNSDVWVVLDHVNFAARSRQSRCRLKTESGIQQLAVGVKRPCNKPIFEMVIDNLQGWRRNFLKSIAQDYHQAPFFKDYFEEITYYIESPNVLLEPLNLQTTMWAAELMGKRVKTFYTKEQFTTYPISRVIPILLDRLKDEPFKDVFIHPEYKQMTDPFEKDLSILDALFCIGAEKTKELLINT